MTEAKLVKKESDDSAGIEEPFSVRINRNWIQLQNPAEILPLENMPNLIVQD